MVSKSNAAKFIPHLKALDADKLQINVRHHTLFGKPLWRKATEVNFNEPPEAYRTEPTPRNLFTNEYADAEDNRFFGRAFDTIEEATKSSLTSSIMKRKGVTVGTGVRFVQTVKVLEIVE